MRGRVLPWTAVAASVAWLTVAAGTGVGQPPEAHWVDLDIYLRSMAGFRESGRLYCESGCTELGFTYPPVAAYPFLALGVLPLAAVRVLWTLGLVVAVLAAALWGARRLGLSGAAAPLSAAVVLASEPMSMGVVQGQASGVVGAAAFVGLAALTPRATSLLSVAAATKITPALGLVPLALDRTRGARARLGVFVGAVAALGALGLLLGPRHTWVYLTTVLRDSSRVGAPGSISNDSLRGLLAHSGLAGPVATVAWGVLVVAVLVALVWACRRADLGDPGARVWVALSVALASYLLTPVTWTHHCLVAGLAAAFLGFTGRPVLGACLALAWTLPLDRISVQHLDGVPQALLHDVRPVTIVLMLVLCLRRAMTPRG